MVLLQNQKLQWLHGGSSGAFAAAAAAIFHRVFHLLTFVQVVEPVIGNGRMVEEDVLRSFGLNETKSLVSDQLFNFS